MVGRERKFSTANFITGPPNGPVLFCTLVSVVCRRRLSSSLTLPAGRPPGAGAVRRPLLHGGPVRLRPVRVTPCFVQQRLQQLCFC